MLSGGHQLASSHTPTGWLRKAWILLTGDEDVALSPPASQRALHATTMKLLQVQHQVDRTRAQHDLEMMRLAQAYQELSSSDRTALPPKLRQQLNRIEAEYFS